MKPGEQCTAVENFLKKWPIFLSVAQEKTTNVLEQLPSNNYKNELGVSLLCQYCTISQRYLRHQIHLNVMFFSASEKAFSFL